MILLELFWTFFKIGLFTFGGGYAMIPMITDEVVNHLNWLTYDEVVNFIAISESTPGPFAINMATFVGNLEGGIIGGIIATLGVILPSFIIILIVSKLYIQFRESRAVNGFFTGVQPVVSGLILSAYVTILLSVVLPFIDIKNLAITEGKFDYVSLILIAVFTVIGQIKINKKKIHPIIIILLSAVVGIIVFGVFNL